LLLVVFKFALMQRLAARAAAVLLHLHQPRWLCCSRLLLLLLVVFKFPSPANTGRVHSRVVL
jgi:hypothetical protein